MKLHIAAASWLAVLASCVPTQSSSTALDVRADTSLVGYMGVFFLGSKENVYFYLSDGNNAFSYKALNKGNPVLVPKLGTGGVRDPSLITGAGPDAGKKWYIIGTDLQIGKTSWDACQRTGSKSIYIWESTDLINWGTERLVKVEAATAGMVWAPDAIWDESKSQYLVHWATRSYSTSDTGHTGKSSASQIRYAYTSDFQTFSAPETYIAASTSVIDLSLLHVPASNATNNQTYVRFLKNEDSKYVYTETSTTGLFGTWTRPGGSSAVLKSSVEGPYAWFDNAVEGRVNLIVDYYGGDGYKPFYSAVASGANVMANSGWTDGSTSGFPKGLRHGSVMGVTKERYDALKAKWG